MRSEWMRIENGCSQPVASAPAMPTRTDRARKVASKMTGKRWNPRLDGKLVDVDLLVAGY